ncbi:alpha/beta fold hydrolase [Afifella sp. IM 167]|uniref:alpha/beta fold hydrolase n=1 Tax=Afifella sp. IM 167 TaxID=2033586 RepID=UPI001CC968D0|nr:alpha/beta hydrolase [Afifella sp. IM 167]MBZ8132227.1 alpha/beta hydrolase [Afifella sp. IM 167]
MNATANAATAAGQRADGATPAAPSTAAVTAPHVRPGRTSATLPDSLAAERFETEGRAGPLSFYVAGQGRPLLLIHSINAAGSAYEVRPIFQKERENYRVYAVDLPGFGFSDRSDRDYNVRLYVDAIHDMLDVIAADTGSEEPVDALALSLSSEFLARAANERPQRFRSLAFVTPTGFESGASKRHGLPGSSREVPFLYSTLTFPLWSKSLYKGLTSRPSIRFFLKKTFGDKEIDESMLEYDYLTTHQPGARHAPYAFVSGKLFSGDIRAVYERLAMPVLLAHGTRGDFSDFTEADWARARKNWTVKPFKTGALIPFQAPEPFFAAYEAFLAESRDKAEPKAA